jgi:hypothetical protein
MKQRNLIALLLAALLTACGGGGHDCSSPNTPQDAPCEEGK